MMKVKVNTISGSIDLIESSRRANITLPNRTRFIINNALFSTKSRRYIIKSIHLDNADEFTSQAFNDYCMSLGINIEHLVTHVHTQNDLVKSLIKHLQLLQNRYS